MSDKLNGEARRLAFEELRDWAEVEDRDAIRRTFRFADFNEAFAFMTRAALYAERHDHHPEWSNVYNRVEIVLTSHDVKGLSARDIAFARFLDGIAMGDKE